MLALLGAIVVVSTLPTAAGATSALPRPEPKILSASLGTDGAVGCPNGEQGLDNIPVTFNWFVRRASIQPADFRIVRSDGSVIIPSCALQFPPDERDEAQTVDLIGDFGDATNGPTPVAIRVVGALWGKSPGARRWRRVGAAAKVDVDPIAGGPYIVDAWTLMPSIYRGDRNRCLVGGTFVRVMWSNGLTAYPTGKEVGASGRGLLPALYKLPRGGPWRSRRSKSPTSTTMKPRSTPTTCTTSACRTQPRRAELAGVTIAADLIQDPDGDPNLAQNFRIVPTP